MSLSISLTHLAEALNIIPPTAGGDRLLSGVKPLDIAMGEHLSFLDNPAYRPAAKSTRAGAVLVKPDDAKFLPPDTVALLTPKPYVALAKALAMFHPTPELVAGISNQAIVSGKASVHETARIEPGAVVYAGAAIGARVHIGAGTVIGENVVLGAGSVISANCTIIKARVGERCLFHAGVRIGQDGFGFAHDGMELIKVPQVGGVVIGNDVEIGANACIDCGALGDTVIEDMVKIDNLVQIAHNVRIGRCTRVVAQVGIAGSSTLGTFNVIGGQSGVAGHVTLADGVMVAAHSGVTKDIPAKGAVVAGTPAEPIQQWRKKVAVISRLLKKADAPDSEPSGS